MKCWINKMRVPDSVNLVAAFREIRKGVKTTKDQSFDVSKSYMHSSTEIADSHC